jgi:hypothetical protein
MYDQKYPLAESLRQRGELVEAARLFAELARDAPAKVGPALDDVINQLAADKVQRKQLTIESRDVYCELALAELQHGNGNLCTALFGSTVALLLDNTYAQAYSARADAWEKLGVPEYAEKDRDQAKRRSALVETAYPAGTQPSPQPGPQGPDDSWIKSETVRDYLHQHPEQRHQFIDPGTGQYYNSALGQEAIRTELMNRSPNLSPWSTSTAEQQRASFEWVRYAPVRDWLLAHPADRGLFVNPGTGQFYSAEQQQRSILQWAQSRRGAE